MKKAWMTILVVALSMSVVATEALAKRAGGGGSVGMQRSVTPTAPVAAPKPAAQPSSASSAATPAAAGAAAKSSWMGPLMGFAAGGLLAALLFGGGFEGISGMDIVVLLLLVGAAFLFLRRRTASPTAATPTHGGYARESMPEMSAPTGMRDVVMGSRVDALGASPDTMVAAPLAQVAPEWFDETSFIAQAKEWYVRVQSAWDNKDYAFLAAITTPALLAEFKRVREQQTGESQTRVDEIQVAPVMWAKEQGQWLLTVRFTGYVAEEAGAFPHAFNEYWHLVRIGDAQGEWRLAGIQQA